METNLKSTSHDVWERAKSVYLSTLQSEEERSQVDRYLSMITSVTRTGNEFLIRTSNAYSADFLRDNYSERLQKCLELVSTGEKISLEFKCDQKSKPVTPAVHQSKTPKTSSSAWIPASKSKSSARCCGRSAGSRPTNSSPATAA